MPQHAVESPDLLPWKQQDAWDRVNAYREANPGSTIMQACKALKIQRGTYDTAKFRLKLGGYDVNGDRIDAFEYSHEDQIRPGDPILKKVKK